MTEQPDTELLAPFKQRRQRNLAYFQKYYPGVHKHFKDRPLEDVDLIIKPSRGDVDLIVGGTPLYNGRARAVARHEVKSFCAKFDCGGTMNPGAKLFFPKADEDAGFALKHLARIANQSPLTADGFAGYAIDGYFPMMVFMGCGLGYHIESMLEKRDIYKAIVFETNPGIFTASLYTVDWKRICTNHLEAGREIQFYIETVSGNQSAQDALIRDLRDNFPLYPVTAQHFLHKGSQEMRRRTDQFNKDIQTYLTMRGGYDDFILRFNNAVYFCEKGIPPIPPKNSIQSNKPVLIVGSGPSVDDRLEDIRSVRDQILLVTAGTGLDGLLDNGIRPDIHLEIDPNYIIYHRHKLNSEAVKNIRFLGSPDVYPLLWDIFGESRFYNPHANPIAPLFGPDIHQTRKTAPTCTNAAIAVFSQLGYTNLFLFGTDYGFRDHAQHHSKHSALYANDDEKIRARADKQNKTGFARANTFKVNSTDGDTCYTNPTFNAARIKAEELIADIHDSNPGAHFYNCSDGAHIEGAQWLSDHGFISAIKNLSSDGDSLNELFSHKARPLQSAVIHANIRKMCNLADMHLTTIRRLVENHRPRNKRDMTELSSATLDYLRKFKGANQSENPIIRQLTAGLIEDGIKNFIIVGFTHTLAMKTDDDAELFLDSWSDGFIQFLKELPEDIRKNVFTSADDSVGEK